MESKQAALESPMCGNSKSLRLCGSCKKVGYCSREHQRHHWKEHRGVCTYQSKKSKKTTRSGDMVVVVEIKSGEGLGLSNEMVNHVFDSRVEAKTYIRERFGISTDDVLHELNEMPFLTELMGFHSATLFVNPHSNQFFPRSHDFLRCNGFTEPLNAMAIYLWCRIDSGLSTHVNASGVAFFIGTTALDQPVTSNVLGQFRG